MIMVGKMANRKYVSKADCQQAMSPLVSDITKIKESLIGTDMRGGIVKDIQELNGKIDSILDEAKEAKQIAVDAKNTSSLWKMAVFAAVVSVGVAVIGLIVLVG